MVDACDIQLTFDGLYLGLEFVVTLWCNMCFLSLSPYFSQSCCWSCTCVSLFASIPGSFVDCLECGCEYDPELVMDYPGSFVV